MAKIELKKNPVLRFLMWGCRVIAVDRSAGGDAYRAAVDELRKGEIVGVYPEATISRSFEIKTLKSGAARMALEADVPIIPCIVWGSQRIATKGLPRQLGRTKTPVMVSIGEPIPPTGTADELTDAAARGDVGSAARGAGRVRTAPRGRELGAGTPRWLGPDARRSRRDGPATAR